MQQTIHIQLLPSESSLAEKITATAAIATGYAATDITGFHILKRSIDARSKQPRINLTLNVYIKEPFYNRAPSQISFGDVSHASQSVIIIGAGPAGLFAALKLIEAGIKPIILERGKDTRARRRDLAQLNKEGIVNPESNYCFGEGGAGTYSDGKLYTRSSKRGDVNRILSLLVQFGAPENILYDAHPHIGTNKLPQIIESIRRQILASGGLFLFEKKVTDLSMQSGAIRGVITADGESFSASAVILATGHSARDIFEMLQQKNIEIHFKPFALGVRIEHPQNLVDRIQYHNPVKDPSLPPASYSFVEQVAAKGVFSFCMCPGGIIASAATAPGEIVVNGWSPSKRNNPYANSGIVVSVDEKDIPEYRQFGPLAGLRFQQYVEKKSWESGGGALVAPAQRMIDFCENRISGSLPPCSYLPGIASRSLKETLPSFIYDSLREAFVLFGKKMTGYYTNDAVIVATESRTSSPVRIPRDPLSLQHPQVKGLYPCGEGAGYAGGIVSAAMDGERVATQIAVAV